MTREAKNECSGKLKWMEPEQNNTEKEGAEQMEALESDKGCCMTS